MKKQIFILLSFLICMTACTNKESEEPDLPDPLEKYMWYGRLHNSFLENADREFSNSEIDVRADNSSNVDSLSLDDLKQFQIDQARNCGLSPADSEILVSALEETDSYYIVDNMWEDIFPNNSMDKMLNYLRQLQTAKYIDNNERIILRDLLTAIHQNKNDKISNYEFAVKVNDLCHIWSNYSRLYGEEWGVMSGVILAISKSSSEWWDQYIYEARSASAIISADVGGAVLNGTFNAIIQYIRTRKIDIKTVGLHALGGAITSSTGLAGKVGKWILSVTKIFKLPSQIEIQKYHRTPSPSLK